MKKNDSITFRVDAELKKRLQFLADVEKRTLSQYIEVVLNDFVNEIYQPASDYSFERKVAEIKKRASVFAQNF